MEAENVLVFVGWGLGNPPFPAYKGFPAFSICFVFVFKAFCFKNGARRTESMLQSPVSNCLKTRFTVQNNCIFQKSIWFPNKTLLFMSFSQRISLDCGSTQKSKSHLYRFKINLQSLKLSKVTCRWS